MTFEESVGRIAALSGEAVDLEIWGNADGTPVAFFSGELRPMPDLDTTDFPPELARAVGETAEVFVIGERHDQSLAESIRERKTDGRGSRLGRGADTGRGDSHRLKRRRWID